MKNKENKEDINLESANRPAEVDADDKKNDIYDKISEIEGVGRTFQEDNSESSDKVSIKDTDLKSDIDKSDTDASDDEIDKINQTVSDSKKIENKNILENIKSNIDNNQDKKDQTKFLKVTLGLVFILFIVSAAFMVWSLIQSKKLKTEIVNLNQDKSMELARYNNLRKKYNKNLESKKEISKLSDELKKAQAENDKLKKNNDFYKIEDWGVKFQKNESTKNLIFAMSGGNDSVVFTSKKLSVISEEKGEGENKSTTYPCSINSKVAPKKIVRKKANEIKDTKDVKVLGEYAYIFTGFDNKCSDKNTDEQEELNKSIREVLQSMVKIETENDKD